MKFDLNGSFTLSGDATSFKKDIEQFLTDVNKNLLKKETPEKSANVDSWKIEKNKVSVNITSGGFYRAHSALLQMKNLLSKELGKKHHVGVREIKIDDYKIMFELDKKALKQVQIPFAKVSIKDKNATMTLEDVSEEFLQKNYILIPYHFLKFQYVLQFQHYL